MEMVADLADRWDKTKPTSNISPVMELGPHLADGQNETSRMDLPLHGYNM